MSSFRWNQWCKTTDEIMGWGLNEVMFDRAKSLVEGGIPMAMVEAYVRAPSGIFLQSNGQTAVAAVDREEAVFVFNALGYPHITSSDVSLVDELSPRDRNPEVVNAVKNRVFWQISC